MLTKAKVQDTLDKFPDTFSIEELVERLIFLDKIERANAQSENGDTISEDQLAEELKKWFK